MEQSSENRDFTPRSPEDKEREYPYDAIVVLGGGLQKVGEKFYPTDYRQGDQFGMSGAGIRMVAAMELYFGKKTRNFVFSTGITEKNIAKHGPGVPTEAEVYQDKFLRVLDGLKKRQDYKDKFQEVEAPVITLEDISFNTMSNIIEVLKIIKNKGWHCVAIVSSDWHIPRIEALYKQALAAQAGIDVNIDFLSAEKIVTEAEPGKYDDVIKRAYDTNQAKTRLQNESSGLQDIREGKYFPGEFQLKQDKGTKQ